MKPQIKKMKFSEWLLSSLGLVVLALIMSVMLFTMLPINGALISIIFTSIAAKFRPLEMSRYLPINVVFIISYTLLGVVVAMNDLRGTPYFEWMFFEAY